MSATVILQIIGIVFMLGGFLMLVFTLNYFAFTVGIILIFVGLVLLLYSMEKVKKSKKR
jgi:predicted membrane protein